MCCRSRRRLVGGASPAAAVSPGRRVARSAGSEELSSFHGLPQNDVRSSTGATAGPSQETLQGGVGQEILEGESDFRRWRGASASVCAFRQFVCSVRNSLPVRDYKVHRC